MSETSMTRKVGISSLWTVGTRVSIQLISLVSMVLLARWIEPAQMGLFEKVAIIVMLLEMLSALGLETALIQRKTLDRSHYDTAWTLNIARAALMAVVLLLLCFKADSWFNAPGISAILPWIALMPLLNGFENIGMVDVRRNHNFSVEYQWMVSRRIASFVVSIGLAWYSKSVWALVYGSLAGALAGLILSYRLSPYRPHISLAGWHDLRKFVGWFFSFTTISAVSAKVDELLLLRFAVPTDVAFYRRAVDFAGIPSSEFAGPMVRALLPALSQLQDQPVARRALFVKFLSLAMLVAVPACFGLALVADPLVHVLLGDRWQPVVPLLQIIAVSGIMRSYQACAESAFIAINRVDINAKYQAAALLWRLPLLSYGLIVHGIQGLALALIGSSIISLTVSLYLHRRFGTLGLREIVRSLWRIVLSAIFMIFITILAMQTLASSADIARLLVASLFGATSYIFAVYLLWHLSRKPDSAEAMIIEQIELLFKRAT
jgi:lipopolysaccharide exporter